MAMNKAEKAALEAAQNEARLRELFTLLPKIEPDVPAPCRENGYAETRGWLASFNGHYSASVSRVMSSVSGHWTITEDGRKVGSGTQNAKALYSTKELAFEAARRAWLWDKASNMLQKVQGYERNN